MIRRHFKINLNDIETEQPWTIICESKDAEESIIKFYDAGQYDFNEDEDGADIGQFVASYYIPTILQHHNKLSLHLSKSSWEVSYHIIQIIQFLIMKII